MFAFALWDRRARELWLVRDRIGIKPLYYSVHHGRLTFASEIKALLEDPDQSAALTRGALPLPLVPHDARAADALRGHPEAPRRHVAPRPRTGRARGAPVLGRLGSHVSAIRRSGRRDRRARLAELRTRPATESERRPRRRVPVRRDRLEHQRGASSPRARTDPVRTFSIGYQGGSRHRQNELHYARLMVAGIGAEHITSGR